MLSSTWYLDLESRGLCATRIWMPSGCAEWGDGFWPSEVTVMPSPPPDSNRACPLGF